MSDTAEAGALAKTLLTKGASDDDVRASGLLDAEIGLEARAEVAVELGRGGIARALTLLEPTSALDRAAAFCGAGLACVDVGIAYAKERHVFGKPLIGFQVQRHNFAYAASRMQAALALVRRVAAAGEAPSGGDAEVVENAAADAAWHAAETALQVHGGYGYTDEFPISVMWTEIAQARRKVEPAEVP